MTKENSPTIRLAFEVNPFDLIDDIAKQLSAEEAIEFVRQLDSKMEDWGVSDLIIAYGKELEALRTKEQEAEENPVPVYAYWAKTADGTDMKGRKEAASVGALVADLKRQGLIVINVEKTEE